MTTWHAATCVLVAVPGAVAVGPGLALLAIPLAVPMFVVSAPAAARTPP